MSSPAQKSFVASEASFSNVRPSVMHFIFDLVAQTFIFGVYTLLLCLSTRMLLKRGLKTRDNKIMLAVTLFMYFLSVAYWTYFVVYAADLLRAHINVAAKPLSDHDQITEWLPLVNAIALITFVLSDGVLIWRARAFCQRQLRKYLWISIGFLGLTAAAAVVTISFQMVPFFTTKSNALQPAFDISLIPWVFSLLSILSATSVVAVTAWRQRRILRNTYSDEEGSDQVLARLTKISLFYCLSTASTQVHAVNRIHLISQFLTLIFSFIPLPTVGTLGDLYYPLSVQIASAYPPALILLVDMNRSLSETTFSDPVSGRSTPAHPMPFRSADVSPTTTVGGPTTTITGPDIIHPLKKTLSNMSTPKHSRFSDTSLDPRRIL